MKDIIKNIANMIKVKTVISIVVVVVFAILALKGIITGPDVKDVTLMVLAFYFGTQANKGGTV